MGEDKGSDRRCPELSSRVDEFASWWDQHLTAVGLADQVCNPLFHYTSMSGLAGIIKSQEMWFTSIFHLNDPSELAYGIGFAMEQLEIESRCGNNIVEKFCREVAHRVVKAGGEIVVFYVASFSSARDDLCQWRAYGDDGRGTSIGLAPRLFRVEKRDNPPPNERVFLSTVTYDQAIVKARQHDVVRRAVDIIIQSSTHGTALSERDSRELDRLGNHLIAAIYWYGITCKALFALNMEGPDW